MTIKEKDYSDLVEILTQENEDLKNKYSAEHKSRQEAEGETNIVKAIGQNSPEMKAAKLKIEELQVSMDRLRKENSECYNRIATLIEDHKKEVKNLKWIKDHDYIFLVDENKKLHKEVDNLKRGEEKRINRAREAGF